MIEAISYIRAFKVNKKGSLLPPWARGPQGKRAPYRIIFTLTFEGGQFIDAFDFATF